MALPRRRINTPGGAPRDYPTGLWDTQGNWEDWLLRKGGSSVWSLIQQPGTSISKLDWLNDGIVYGGALHPRQKAVGPAFQYEVHMRVGRPANATWLSSMGPAVNMRDRGAGNTPDMVAAIPIYLAGLSLLVVIQAKTGVISLLSSVVVSVVPGDIISIFHNEVTAGVSTTYHCAVNGKIAIVLGGATPVNPHTVTDKPGIMGPAALTVASIHDVASQWWVTSSTTQAL